MSIEDMLKGGNLEGLMQQAQQMQQQMQQAQARARDKTVIGEAGGGMVKVTANGHLKVLGVEIDPIAVGEDVEMLQDLVVAAVNDALAKARKVVEAELGPLGQALKASGLAQ